MKIICYGDSNTYGFDPRLGSPGRLAKNERWTGILDSEPDIEIENEGMNGRCIPSASYEYRSLKKILEGHCDADMLIIMLGSNDLFMTRGATAEKIADKMRNVFVNVPELTRWKTSGTTAAGDGTRIEKTDPACLSSRPIGPRSLLRDGRDSDVAVGGVRRARYERAPGEACGGRD